MKRILLINFLVLFGATVLAQVLSPVHRRAIVLAGLAQPSGGPPLANLILWVDANVGTYWTNATDVTTNGQTLLWWQDRTSLHNDVTNYYITSNLVTFVSAGGPNGSNAISFANNSAGRTWMSSHSVLVNDSSSNCMVIAVWQPRTADNGDGFSRGICSEESQATINIGLASRISGGAAFSSSIYGTLNQSAPGFSINDWLYTSLVYSNNHIYMFTNGVFTAHTTWTSARWTGCVLGNTSTNSGINITMGGRIAEVLLYDGQSTVTRSAADLYIKNKYGFSTP